VAESEQQAQPGEMVVGVPDLYATIGALEVDKRVLMQQVQIRDQRIVDLVDQLQAAHARIAELAPDEVEAAEEPTAAEEVEPAVEPEPEAETGTEPAAPADDAD
jgi:hypothetical protein